ncbi:unnamed protein product, partial [Meganyctiphanes norvegica]
LSNSRVRLVEGLLLFSPVRQDDQGRYTCQATNDHGDDNYSIQVLVRIRVSASLSPPVQRVDLSGSARLVCQVSGQPIDSLTWYKDGQPLGPTSRVHIMDKTLQINQ